MIIASIIIIGFYSFLIIAFIIGFDRTPVFNDISKNPQTRFSIIVPFRNEAENLPVLLKSIHQLNYPKDFFEILFVDDDSTDNSVEIIERFLTQNLELQNDIKIVKNIRKTGSPKKDAIETAIKQANFDWILTTDADCVLPKNWLSTFDAFIQKHHPELIAAPVIYNSNNSFFEQFQFFDFLSLQASTIGGFGIGKPFLCNGANLCYHKQAYFAVKGFEGNEQIASGDDIFLLEKFVKKHPEKVHFLKSINAIVTTKPQPTLQMLLSQRIRWSAKATAYNNNFAFVVGISVFLVNLLLTMIVLLLILNFLSWKIALAIIITKLTLDFILLNKASVFFKRSLSLKYYFASSLLYPFFSMFVAIASLQTQFDWKGRQFKK